MIANVKSYERSSYSIFLFTKLFFIFFSYLNTQFFNNFPNLLFFEFLRFFSIIKFCEFFNLGNLQIQEKISTMKIFEIVKILEVC